MTDSTRPYHWGRENPNYAGPSRADTSRRAAVSDPRTDTAAPGPDYPEGSPAARLAELARSSGPLTDAEMESAGVLPGADEVTRELFSQVRCAALAELAAYTDTYEVPAEDLPEEVEGDEASFLTRALADDLAERHPGAARDYAGTAENPVEALSHADRDFGAASPDAVRSFLGSGYARAVADGHLSDGAATAELLSRAPSGPVEEAAHNALGMEHWEEADRARALRNGLYRAAGSLTDAELYSSWAAAGGPGDYPEGLVRKLYSEHARAVATAAITDAAREVAIGA